MPNPTRGRGAFALNVASKSQSQWLCLNILHGLSSLWKQQENMGLCENRRSCSRHVARTEYERRPLRHWVFQGSDGSVYCCKLAHYLIVDINVNRNSAGSYWVKLIHFPDACTDLGFGDVNVGLWAGRKKIYFYAPPWRSIPFSSCPFATEVSWLGYHGTCAWRGIRVLRIHF